MATHTVRRATPTAQSPTTSVNFDSILPYVPAVPERSASRSRCATFIEFVPGRLQHSASSPVLPSDHKVRFGELPVPDRDVKQLLSTTSTACATIASSDAPSLPPRSDLKIKYKEEFGESSKNSPSNDKLPQPTKSLPKADNRAELNNPFADPATVDDVPELIPTEADPFGDFYSVASSYAKSNSASDTDQPTPQVHVVDGNDVFSPTGTPIPRPDLKEDQAFFIALEQFNHPDIARMQFQCQRGVLWDSAVTLLMDHYLHPVDLTEDEFVVLVCSQGNATSNWLEDNTRLISSRRMNNRIKLHRELTRVGLPPSSWTEEYLDLYEAMNKEERERLVDWLQMLKIDVQLYEEHMDLTEIGREKYMGMTFIEKADFIGLHNLEIMKIEKANERKSRIEISAYSSASTKISTSFGEPLERMKSVLPENSDPPPYPEAMPHKTASQVIGFLENALHSAIYKVSSPRRSAATSSSSSRSKLLHSRDCSTDCPGELPPKNNAKLQRSSHDSGASSRFKSKLSRFGFDSAIDLTNTSSLGKEVPRPVSDYSVPGLLKKVKSGFFVDRTALIPQSPQKANFVKIVKSKFRNSSFDSDAVSVKLGENMSTAKRAVFAAPLLVQISPPSSTRSIVGTESQIPSASCEEVPVYSFPATTAALSSLPAGNNRSVRIKRSVAERLSHESKCPIDTHSFNEEYVDVPEHQLATAQSHVNVDTPKKAHGLKRTLSNWTLRPRHRRSGAERLLVDRHATTDFGKALDKVTTLEGSRRLNRKQTLRKRISTIFGTAAGEQQQQQKGKDGKEGELVVMRKLFGRKAIPEWEFLQ